jgi:hypothetical protein
MISFAFLLVAAVGLRFEAELLDQTTGRWPARPGLAREDLRRRRPSWWSTPPASAATRPSSKRSKRCTRNTRAGIRRPRFPSGDFKAQEYDDEKQIKEFCTLTYGVKFPMFEKVHVVGREATPLYRTSPPLSGRRRSGIPQVPASAATGT